AQRESLYVSNRATANAVGFQVGLVPMDTSLFSDHLIFSGAPDLAKSLRGSAFVAGTLGAVAQAGHLGVPFLPGFAWQQGGNALVDVFNGLSRNTTKNADESIAQQYNLRLLQALSLPYPAWAAPHKQPPAPLDASDVVTGLNEGMDDWVWDRSIHLGGSPNRYLIGGLDTDPGRIGPYMRSQGCVAEAEAYEDGRPMAAVGPWVTLGGTVLLIGGLLGELLSHPPNGDWPTLALVGGVVALPIGITLTLEGNKKVRHSIVAFDANLPGLLRMRLLIGSGAQAH
ncbi:MAG TPA: hypothetical protein VK786_00665, partial [bacterium]|nr:hypothetical protein [bacterium]